MKRYVSYKPSGVDWLGEIPEHWKVMRVKDLFHLNPNLPKRNLESNDQVSFIPMECLRCGRIEKRTLEYKSALSYVPFKNEDILLAKVTPCFENGNIAIAEELENGIGFGSSEIFVIRRNQNLIDKRFAFYFFQSHYFRLVGTSCMKGTGGLKRVDPTTICTTAFPFVSLPEQTKISFFLDARISDIYRTIDLLTAKVDKYNALRRSLINETVCRGLNPDAPLKDSGVEWTGMIPEHWEVKRVKEIGKVVLGKMLCNIPEEGNILKPYLKSKNIEWLNVNTNSVDKMYFSSIEMKALRIKKGDLLLSEGGEVGKTCFWNNEIEECYIQNSVHKITFPKTVNSKYYLYLSFAIGVKGGYDSIVNFISIKHLTYEKLNRFLWCVPPINEQIKISQYLDKKTSQIDDIVSLIGEQICKLTQLRKTLINDVITGKVKVMEDNI